jgi:CRISPR-associated exonuclease Cas4
MYTEDQLLPISALQHWLFCPRQCGLIHLEQIWDENRLTAEGRLLHEKVHEADTENRPGIRIVRGLRIHSYRLGLIGQTDVVEFRRIMESAEGGEILTDFSHSFGMTSGVTLEGVDGYWQPFPVEYKRGKPKINPCDEIQLCAQTICLEEMLKTAIPQGAFFYGKPRRRKEVEISDSLRQQTEEAAPQLHELIDARTTPTACYEKKCDACSLYNRCLPKTTGQKKKVDMYLEKAFELPTEEVNP